MSNTERDQKFQAAFLKKLPTIVNSEIVEDGRPAQGLPPYMAADAIPAELVPTVPSTKNRPVGLPIIFFTEGSFKLLLSTAGVFFTPAEGSPGTLSWSELDFIRTGDLAQDTKLFQAEKDVDLLVKSMSIKPYIKKLTTWFTCAMIAWFIFAFSQYHSAWDIAEVFVLCLLGIVFIGTSFLAIPVAARWWLASDRARVKATYFKEHPDHYNVIVVGRMQKMHLGFSKGANNIIMCMKLGLSIFEAQQRKYGPA